MGLSKFVEFLSFLLFITAPSLQTEDIHDLLAEYKLPKGILPNNVKSYSFVPPSSPSSADGSFSVHLTTPCYVHFAEQLVYYGTEITGKVGYGVVRDVTGIQAKKLFIWLPVTGIEVGTGDDDQLVEFFVGSLSKKLPAEEFQNIPSCESKASLSGLSQAM